MIMKNIVRICMVIFTCLLFTGCYDRDEAVKEHIIFCLKWKTLIIQYKGIQ